MFSAMASLAVSSALWMTATSANPIAIQVAKQYGVDVGFGKWLIASSVPSIIIILALPWVLARIYPPGSGRDTGSARRSQEGPGRIGTALPHERITAVAFILMVSGWIFADKLQLNVTSIAFAGPRLAAGDRRAHGAGHRRAGRHPGDISLARCAVRAERPTSMKWDLWVMWARDWPPTWEDFRGP